MSQQCATVVPGASTLSAAWVPPLRLVTDDFVVGRDEGPVELAEMVAAGPGSGLARADKDRAGGLLKTLAGGDQVAAALKATAGQHACKYNGVLGGVATVLCVLACCVFSAIGYDGVLAMGHTPGLIRRIPGAAAPRGAAFSQARVRVGEAPLRVLFEVLAAIRSSAAVMWHGLEVDAVDGTTLAAGNDPALAGVLGVPTCGTKPLIRLVTIVGCASRRVKAAAFGGYLDSEQGLAGQLKGALGRGRVLLADRNFFAMARWIAFADTGEELVWRVKNGSAQLPCKVIHRLPDGSCLVRLRESTGMWQRRRKAAGDAALPRLPDTIARLVEFDVVLITERGRVRRSRFRLLTTLLDCAAYPASDLAELYAERWQIEVSYLHLKQTLRGPGRVLRGRCLELVRQEVWACLIVYNWLCDLAVDAAAVRGIDSRAINMTAVVHLLRAHVTADTCCATCGNAPTSANAPTGRLVAQIAAHPANRTGRGRTGPRTKKDRLTGHTENASYTINIVTSTLPKLDENADS